MEISDRTALKEILSAVIKENISPQGWEWLNSPKNLQNTLAFNTAFVLIPRKTAKKPVTITASQERALTELRTGFSVKNWTTDRLCRAWLLLSYEGSDPENYFTAIETLFSTAEMNELVALYSALPLLLYPELWIKRCAEGIRSNIGTVLEAIMYNNPYPAEYLDEAAWNQMVLKAFFTEKQVDRIYGLDERANEELARILTDYARERYAAGRQVDPMLWYLVGKFVDSRQVEDMKTGTF